MNIQKNRLFFIRNKANGNALDICGGNRNQGAQVIAYALHRGPNQQWLYTDEGHIKSVLNGLVIQ